MAGDKVCMEMGFQNMGVFAHPPEKVYSTDPTIRTEMKNGILLTCYNPCFMRLLLHLGQKLADISLRK